jgi:myo-inositol-1(or 4)-monophosphatase
MPEAIEIATTAARTAGALVRERADAVVAIRTKSTALDLVSETDVAAGVAAVNSILAHEPDARFVVEEDEVYGLTGGARGELFDERVWVIDPIDGTTSFLHSYPCYSVSIACLERGELVAGAVYNAALDEMNSAVAGGGAFRDGKRLSVTTGELLGRAVLATGFSYDRTRPLDLQLAAMSALLRAPVQDLRRDGSAAIDCCHVAAGRCDGFWEYALKVWDMAAGVLILREAGARVTDIDGTEWTPRSDSICAANPALHAQMLDVIQTATRGL